MSKESFTNTAAIQASLKKRYAREKRFQWYGRLAVLTGFVFLFILLADIVGKGAPAFTQQYIKVTVEFEELRKADYLGVVKSSLRAMFPEASGRQEKRQLYRLISIGAEYDLRDYVLDNPELIGQTLDIWLLAHAEAGAYLKGQGYPDAVAGYPAGTGENGIPLQHPVFYRGRLP
jgi:phosphate transport system permease protein